MVECLAQRDYRRVLPRSHQLSIMASASISTSISGLPRATATVVEAGIVSPSTSLWALPTASKLAMSVTNTRVRMTSDSVAPTCCNAHSIVVSACLA